MNGSVRSILAFVLLVLATGVRAQKSIYIPEDLRRYDLDNDTSKWSWKRSSQTENLIFFWEKGFGDDLANPPLLEGHPMAVNLKQLEERVEHFYSYFRDTLNFTLPGSKAERYKMMVMINYSLEGTAYGGTYDDFIGALWVAPNRIQDEKLNCLAHELGHSFQAQIPADGVGDAWGGCGFFEMASQWMLWRVNPDWITDELYHFDAFKKLTHKAYLHLDNIYHSPYVIEYWAEKRGLKSVAELFRQGRRGEDPVQTYKRMYGLTQEDFNDEMFDCYSRLVNFDYDHARNETRRYACTFSTPLDTLSNGWMQPAGCIPEAYGFNAVVLPPVDKTTVAFRGNNHRYGFVGVTTEGESVYSPAYSVLESEIHFEVPEGKQWAHLYLIVMGAPEQHVRLDEMSASSTQYNYQFCVK